MEQFTNNHSIWLIPTKSIVLSILFKVEAKNSRMKLNYIDLLDFGFGLSVTSIIMILTNLHDEIGTLLLFGFMIAISSTKALVNRVGWDIEKERLNLFGVLFPDAIGISLLVVSAIYINGGV
ncbi:MAG: hypothetical protein FWC70_10455 [Defluviitaleaceae bacterium]|nr:hypothetical protein [Defluviitaleaceae bacterium]